MRAKTLAIVVFLAAGTAAVVIPTVRKNRAESAAAERRERDKEIGAYYEQNVKPRLAGTSSEPDHVVGKILPVVVKDDIPIGDGEYRGTGLDTSLYTELDPAVRTDRLADAGTLAVILDEGSALYAGDAGGGVTRTAMVRNGMTVALFATATKTVLGIRSFGAGEPPKETNQAGLDFYAAQQAARVAAYLKTLPAR